MKKSMWLMICGAIFAAHVCSASSASANSAVAAARPSAASDAPSEASTTPGVINLNEASPEQLALLPGVGPSRARAILAYRKNHPFKRPEELMRVKGFGKKSYARLRPLLSLTGQTTLKTRPHLSAAHHTAIARQ